MALPNFLIVGAQKCGTTTLYDVLKEHPEVNMSTMKEINFFTFEKKYGKGISYYSTFFEKKSTKQKVSGEASPGYMNYPGIAKRIYDDLGPIKIVMVLRDPIKRAYSQYWDNRRHLSEYLSEEGIIDRYLTSEYNNNSKGYFSRGVYIKYIEEYLQYFDRRNLHVMLFEDLIQNPKPELKKLYTFLGIDTSEKYLELSKASNTSMVWNNFIYQTLLKKPSLTRWLPKHGRKFLFFGKQIAYSYALPDGKHLKILQDFYKPWNKKLEHFLDRKIENWKVANSKD